MSVHDFEKQVQAKMEQLKLRPSEAVWTNVNMRVRQERRRRRVILWMPILLLMLGAGGYFLLNQPSHKNAKLSATEKNSTHNDAPSSSETTVTPATTGADHDQPVSSLPSEITKQGEKNAGSPALPNTVKAHEQQTVPAYSATAPEQPALKAENKTKQPEAAVQKIKTPLRQQGVKSTNTAEGLEKYETTRLVNKKKENIQRQPVLAAVPKPAPGKGRNDAAEIGNKTGNGSGNNTASNISKKDIVNHEDEKGSNAVKANENDQLANTAGVDSGNVSTSLAILSPVQHAAAAKSVADSLRDVRKDSIKAARKAMNLANLTPPPSRKPSSWSFGISAEGGGSHISKGSPFDLLDKKNEEPENLAPQNSPNTNAVIGGPAGFAQAPSKPSGLKTGLSWSAGGFVQKKLSERVSISAGLQYTYFSQKTAVGQFMRQAISVSNQNYDQVVQSYYAGRTMLNSPGFATATWPRPPKEQEYTNKYHFIEMPLKVHWRITGEEQVPIIVDGGISLARLLSTNALHYDGANDVYYKDYTYFNKLQAGVTAGMNIALFNESNHPVWIGPTIKYQLSNLLKSDLSNGQHLWSFGLGARMFLKKQ